MNIFDILILLAVAGIALFGLLRARKRKCCGKGCCGTCTGCEACALCAGRKKP